MAQNINDLWNAIAMGDEDEAITILTHKNNAEIRENAHAKGKALIGACTAGMEVLVVALLSLKKVRDNAHNNNNAAVNAATKNGHTDIVKILMDNCECVKRNKAKIKLR